VEIEEPEPVFHPFDIAKRRDYYARKDKPVLILEGEGDCYMEVRGEWVHSEMFADFEGMWHV